MDLLHTRCASAVTVTVAVPGFVLSSPRTATTLIVYVFPTISPVKRAVVSSAFAVTVTSFSPSVAAVTIYPVASLTAPQITSTLLLPLLVALLITGVAKTNAKSTSNVFSAALFSSPSRVATTLNTYLPEFSGVNVTVKSLPSFATLCVLTTVPASSFIVITSVSAPS